MTICEFGLPLIWCALLASALAAALYFAAATSRRRNFAGLLRSASYAYVVALLSVIGVCGVLMTLLVTHDFSVDYVYKYSSRELEIHYLYATFWAGQDGSILLWAFWIAVLGWALSGTLSPIIRARTMSVYAPVLVFLIVLLAVRNPFSAYVPSPGQPLHPTDGIGLNPLLENPWMVIHPPTLFLGFAALTIPFAFAVSALLWGDDPDWYRRAWPWALFTFATLGFGVMLGGYWAYETLGWGGFWGWDPVEDGPLVPWLSTIALLHAIQVNRVRGGLKKSTLFLALFGFVAALYETFLTRTGVLDKFSNHSFSTLGGADNSLILYFLIFAALSSTTLLYLRASKIQNGVRVWENASSREFSLTLCFVILMICVVIVTAGMSAPLITAGLVYIHLMSNQSSVQADFFNKANFPEAVLLGFGMGIGPILAWGKSSLKDVRPLLSSLFAAFALTIVYGIIGASLTHVHLRPVMLILFLSCIFAILTNCRILFSRIRPKGIGPVVVRTAGGALAHIGAALLLIGVVGLVLFTHKESPTLAQGQTVKLNGLPYQITFEGMTSDLFHPDDKLKFKVAGLDGKNTFAVLMPFAVRNVEGTQQILARPAISMRWWGDLYFAFENGPVGYSPNKTNEFTIHRGETVNERGYRISLAGYSLPPAVDSEVSQGIVPAIYPLTARLHITTADGKTAEVDPVNTRYKDDPILPAMPEAMLPSNGSIPQAIAFEGADPNSDEASFYIRDSDLPLITSYTIEVSTRPTIGLVWLGTILMTLGGLMSMIRRASENKLSPITDPGAIKLPGKARELVRK